MATSVYSLQLFSRRAIVKIRTVTPKISKVSKEIRRRMRIYPENIILKTPYDYFNRLYSMDECNQDRGNNFHPHTDVFITCGWEWGVLSTNWVGRISYQQRDVSLNSSFSFLPIAIYHFAVTKRIARGGLSLGVKGHIRKKRVDFSCRW